MDQVNVKIAKVVGTARAKSWSQVYASQTEKGEVIIVLSLNYKGEGELVDLAEIGGSLLESLGEKGEITKEEIASLGSEIETAILLVKVRGVELTIAGIGRIEMYLLREGRLGKILAGGSEIKQLNGTIGAGDKILLLTSEMGEMIGAKRMSGVLRNGQEEMENLAVVVHGSDDSSRMAAILMEVQEENPAEIKPEQMKPVKMGGVISEKLAGLLGKFSFRRPLTIGQEKKKWNLAIGFVLMGLLLIGILGGMVRRSRLVKEAAYTELSASVSQKMTEARSVGDLNPERAKLLLAQSGSEIEQYLASTKDEEYLARGKALQAELKKIETEVFKKQEVAVNTLMELAVLKSGTAVEKIFVDEEGNLYFPDTKAAVIGAVSLADKSQFEASLGEMGSAKEIGVAKGKIYGIVEKGIVLVEGKEQKIVIEPDELWGEITLMDVFANNVYLFDRGQSEIWKYPALTEGFGTRRRWLAAGIELDLSKVTDMKVDGDIWLITSTGKLERYSRGVPVEFSMEGFPAAEGDRLVMPAALFVTEEKIYVLENGPGRVVVFNKESGKYERQYSAEAMKEGKDLVIFKDKGYLLLNDKVVWFQL